MKNNLCGDRMAINQPHPLDEINRIVRESRVAEYSSPNLALGMVPIAFSSGSSRWRWPNQSANSLNPFGFVQGGYLAIFVDELFSTAIASILKEGEWSVTAESKLSYLRPVRPGELAGEGRVIRCGSTLAFLEAEVLIAGGKPAVRATSTWAIMRADSRN